MQVVDDLQPSGRILIAVGNDLTRAGLRAILGDMPNVQIVGDAHDARGCLEMVAFLTPDLVLMDFDAPQLQPLATLLRLCTEYPAVKVVAASMVDGHERLLEAIRFGAAGCVGPDDGIAEIRCAISRALAGLPTESSTVASATTRPLIVDRFARPEANGRTPLLPADSLSPRESEVLGLVARGYSNREIAGHLRITACTVKVHVEHILSKLHVRGRTEAAVLALNFGLAVPGRSANLSG